MSTPLSNDKKFPGMNDSYFDGADGSAFATTPDSLVHDAFQALDPEQKIRQEQEWREQLAKVEDEIQTLRQVLASKVRESQDLKRRLGVTVWREFKDDIDHSFRNVRDTEVVQKTETVVKTVAEKTTSVFGAIGSNLTRKIGDVRNSTTFKSFEESVGSAYVNVKEKIASRSNSMQSFDEAYLGNERRSASNTPAMTPTIPENKPLM